MEHPAYDASLTVAHVRLQEDYLLDLVGQEMSPRFSLQALTAQAIAARSYTWNHLNNKQDGTPPDKLDNSVDDHAFIPYRFESHNNSRNPSTYPTIGYTPCVGASGTLLNTDQIRLCNAVVNRTYLARADSILPADAAYIADFVERSQQSPEALPPTNKTYLQAVEDPISRAGLGACSATNVPGNPFGMSQNGANRWARGNQCAVDGNTNDWSVRWERHEQILFHYYTGAHLLNADNRQIVSPKARFNIFRINGLPPGEISSGRSYEFLLQIQNTSIADWPPGTLEVWANWEKIVGPPLGTPQIRKVLANPTQTIAVGKDVTVTLPMGAIGDGETGTYKLVIDMFVKDNMPSTHPFYSLRNMTFSHVSNYWPAYRHHQIFICQPANCKVNSVHLSNVELRTETVEIKWLWLILLIPAITIPYLKRRLLSKQ
ncbi:MAG TPA: SpoIID/LytB domain-containing protein [Anaerolineales bacterium]|nr:SpoIID/LytB domain-containing protein [Anaerolineales bacterium]